MAKAHHFIPVRHLARFGDRPAKPARERRVFVYDKIVGRQRGPTKTGNVAREVGLYTTRTQDLSTPPSDPADLERALFASEARDEGFEIPEKADLENRGVDAVEGLLDPLEPGVHQWDESTRAPLMLYAALLAVGHPTALRARTRAMHDRMTAALPKQIFDEEWFQRTSLEYARGGAVLGTATDMHETALEFNQLSWRLVRRSEPPYFVLGDNAVAALYPETPFGPGRILDSRALLLMPLSPKAMFWLEAGPPGVGRVVDIDGPEGASIVRGLNRIVWMRAAREVYGRVEKDLLDVARSVSPAENRDHSLQFPVREESLAWPSDAEETK